MVAVGWGAALATELGCRADLSTTRSTGEFQRASKPINALWLLPEQASDLVVGPTSDDGYKLVNECAC